ncbi:MAG: sugar phosphate isomerase/epimerase family protein [Planctomycetota bacterium]|jgi:sugar phosphate isomerase/epimerase
MIRFAYSTNAYTKHPLAEAVADIAKAGFDGVEILADVPHAFPLNLAPADVKALRETIGEAGLAIANINGNTTLGLDRDGRDLSGFWPGLVEVKADARAMRVEYVRQVIDMARALGAANVCTASGRLPRGSFREEAWKRLRHSLREILEHAERRPAVRVGLEYEPGLFLSDMDLVLRLIKTVNHPLLGVNLDIGHAVCAGEDPAGAIEAFAGRIWNVHVEDIRGAEHNHLIPGEGDIDFGVVREALENAGYEGFLTLELYPYQDRPGEAGRKGLEFLKEVFS